MSIIDTQQSGLSNHRSGRRLYLATLSQADATRFPTRQSFAEYIIKHFHRGTSQVRIIQWVCSKEQHKEGGFHYHMAMKLNGIKKWYGPWRAMYEDNVVISFSESHDYYISAYRYVTKEDENYIESEGHPDLKEVGSPRTKACMASNRRRSNATSAGGARSLPLLEDADNTEAEVKSPTPTAKKPAWNNKVANIDVADFIIKKGIKSTTELYAEANQRKEDGECDLALFIYARSEKFIGELISKAWKMERAKGTLTDNGKSRMSRIEDALAVPCSNDCTWLNAATEIMQLNGIDIAEFRGAVAGAIRNGRKKYNNIMLTGRSNCGKTFLLKPLRLIFGSKLFENPPRDKYGWQGVQGAQIICLQDFRYNKEVISWSDLLLLLEGETVKLPAPKNHFAEDIVIDSANDIPILATGPTKIAYSLFSPDHHVETEMMTSRWKIFELTHVFAKENQRDIAPCGHCFAKMIFG